MQAAPASLQDASMYALLAPAALHLATASLHVVACAGAALTKITNTTSANALFIMSSPMLTQQTFLTAIIFVLFIVRHHMCTFHCRLTARSRLATAR
jgi:hypothetical protein